MQFKKYAFFRPEDTHGLHQVPPANMKSEAVSRIKGYRYPAPGSQVTAQIPTLENEDTKYDIKYFSRNTRRAGHLDSEGKSNRFNEKFLGKGEVALIDDDAPIGSPGNHYTADTVAEYDLSKLRSDDLLPKRRTRQSKATCQPISSSMTGRLLRLVASRVPSSTPGCDCTLSSKLRRPLVW